MSGANNSNTDHMWKLTVSTVSSNDNQRELIDFRIF